MKTAVVARAHQIPTRLPIQLEVGDHVQVGERDSEWPEFVFVSATHGTGWVPARHLSAGSGSAVVTTPYDTAELPTHAGDVLEVLAEDAQSGWVWCRTANGREGWVPCKTLETPA
ncbi:SH3 domain-containing protein [Microlunatus soli]|uniref:SH3 domain-containing protein n=1 Tax=Microlunatus soli TaxID=630515 RepID=A0A1H1RQI7_9ACTN|nr:SH3 domain-containing protein [Microlunatus soli]